MWQFWTLTFFQNKTCFRGLNDLGLTLTAGLRDGGSFPYFVAGIGLRNLAEIRSFHFHALFFPFSVALTVLSESHFAVFCSCLSFLTEWRGFCANTWAISIHVLKKWFLVWECLLHLSPLQLGSKKNHQNCENTTFTVTSHQNENFQKNYQTEHRLKKRFHRHHNFLEF